MKLNLIRITVIVIDVLFAATAVGCPAPPFKCNKPLPGDERRVPSGWHKRPPGSPQPMVSIAPYSFSYNRDGGRIHQYAVIDLGLRYLHFNMGAFYTSLGWSVAAIRVRSEMEFIPQGHYKNGIVIKLGGLFEPLMWMNKTPSPFGDIEYATGLNFEGGIGIRLPDRFMFGQFILSYQYGVKWPRRVGDFDREALDNASGKRMPFHAAMLSLELGKMR